MSASLTRTPNVNADPAEIAKFADLASRWWDPAGEFKPLHKLNPLRLAYVARDNALKGQRVLDVGCGGGILSEAMAASGAKVTGIDLGEAQLGVARLHLLESGQEVDYRNIPVEQLAVEAPASFDTVTCMEMLEHVPDPAAIVSACATLCKPGGHIVFSTINRNPKSYLFAVLGAEYILRLLPKGTHDYRRFIRPSELGGWARAAGLSLSDVTGMHYNPLLDHFSMGGDVDVNYFMTCQRPRQ